MYSFRSLVDIDNLIQIVVYIELMLFLPMCTYWDRYNVICFKKILKDFNIKLIMKQIKLQSLCSVQPKDGKRN